MSTAPHKRHLRKTGIDAVGDMPWGTHFCHFYETKQDLLEILVPYFKAGLENNEFCLWVVAAPLTAAEATRGLQQAVPDLEEHLANRSLEIQVIGNQAVETSGKPIPDLEWPGDKPSIAIIPYDQWYLKDGIFDSAGVINGWKAKLEAALARGYSGMRVHGNEAWLTERDWGNFLEYERRLNQVLANQKMLVLCAYPLKSRKAAEIFDVAQAHEFAIVRRHGHWEMLETPELRHTKNELAALRKDLERRVEVRTRELKENEQKLRQAQAELARVARLTMMGALTASIAHEINQPLVGVVTNANACLGWLAATPPNLSEARKAVKRIARDGKRAGEVIARIRALLKKGELIRKPLDVNEVIRETIAMIQPELNRKRITLRRELAPKLPLVPADRVQLQQVILNLIVNAADSLNAVKDRRRVLRIRTDHSRPKMVRVEMRDTGVGINPDQAKRLFQPFFTTKQHGLGLGLAISRSIVEAHGGHLRAVPNRGPGATFQFTLPIENGGTW